ncbi:unnamed protein product [Nesidiocoris tenuis]|uniref:Uncharacterized protein n=1 Tax=Nesidiocoris tenuis TaxID=355587 RepID=A0A6H5GNS2_9HEMI|nr:unnamed protein product [Nesidiocoris tenuis]
MNPLRLVKTNQTAEEENAIDYAFAMLPVKKRESEHHGQPIDTDDARVRNLIDWFPTEDEFARVLTLNVRAGIAFLSHFFNRGDKRRQYGIDRFGNVYRIPRAGQEGWESADILEDGLVKKHGSHKNGSGSRTETRRKGQIADAESRLQRSEHHSKRSGESKRQSLRKHSRRDEPTRNEPTRHESRADSELGRSGQFSRRSIDSVKGRGNRKRGRGSGQLGTASRKRKGKTQKEQDL